MEDVKKSTSEERICELLGQRQVVFLTAQKLVNALSSSKSGFSLSDLDMIIFDECHHTADNHPYNEILNSYRRQLDEEDDSESFSSSDGSDWSTLMPIIIGLTASPGVGRSDNALKQLITLCLNLECRHVACLTSKQDLNDHKVIIYGL